ncbi:MAG: rod shape-determining protein MreC [Lachnospiraceae bacterium]|nr:rod shape-determining protein MreC [Lachnospiraceae bacterium]MBR4541625.1 rod shape-determining protein MreC [Lachnospiraceae bacterium]
MGKLKKNFTITSKMIFTFLVIICVGLIIVSYLFADLLAPVRTAVGNFFVPMQKGISTVSGGISETLRIFSDKQKLIDENDKLTSEINNLKTEMQILIHQEYELEWYRYLYENDSVYQNAEKVAARIISRNPNGACDMFVIDKGEEDGIEVDMNVLAGGGLVGIITDVGRNWAKVRTIIADDSSVSGRFQPTSDTCIVKGNMRRMDDGYIDVEMINLNAEVYDNYEVLTSYISDKYLPGILIGYVTNIRKDPSELNKRAYLTPVVDFEHLEAVLIVKTLRENLEGFE